jgi:hypothetical protein
VCLVVKAAKGEYAVVERADEMEKGRRGVGKGGSVWLLKRRKVNTQ